MINLGQNPGPMHFGLSGAHPKIEAPNTPSYSTSLSNISPKPTLPNKQTHVQYPDPSPGLPMTPAARHLFNQLHTKSE